MSEWPRFSTRRDMNCDDVPWLIKDKIVYDRTSWSKEQNWCFALEQKHIGHVGKLYVLYGEQKDSRIVPKFVDNIAPVFHINGLDIDEVRAPRMVNLSAEVAKREFVFKKIADETASDEKAPLILYIGERTKTTHGQLCVLQSLLRLRIIHLNPQIVACSLENSEIRNGIVKHIKSRIEDTVRDPTPKMYPTPKWLSSGTMLFGYCIARPLFPLRRYGECPRIVGFVANCGVDPNEFLGDFHFDEDGECPFQVTPDILVRRLKWMLGLFKKNRGALPEQIFCMRGIFDSDIVSDMELVFLHAVCNEVQTGYQPDFHNETLRNAGNFLPAPIHEAMKWIRIGADIFSAVGDNGFVLPRTSRLVPEPLPILSVQPRHAVDWEKVTNMMSYHGKQVE